MLKIMLIVNIHNVKSINDLRILMLGFIKCCIKIFD